MLTPTQLIAENLQHYRKKKGLTQKELAERCRRHGLNWDQSHISKAENGTYNVILRVDVLVILAHSLGIHVRLLMSPHRLNSPMLRIGHRGSIHPAELGGAFKDTPIVISTW